jgi:hypothetical protein
MKVKQFRVLNITDSTTTNTNQRIAVCELAEVQQLGVQAMPFVPYTFGTTGQKYVIPFDSWLVQDIIQRAQEEEIVELDLEFFVLRKEMYKGRAEEVYYHKTVSGISDNKNAAGNSFGFTAEKINHQGTLELDGNYSPAQFDIALKDICIYLKTLVKVKSQFDTDHSGYFKVTVGPYSRHLSEEEKYLIDQRRLPRSEVIIDHHGFSFEEVLEVMHGFQANLPDEIRSNFMYEVNFKNLTVKG